MSLSFLAAGMLRHTLALHNLGAVNPEWRGRTRE